MNFKKHSQEEKKLIDQVEINENQWSSTKKVYKNFYRAKSYAMPHQKTANEGIEQMYHIVVKKVKEWYKTLPNPEDRVIVEIDLKQHPKEVSGMHILLSRHFYFYLECDINKDYRVEFHFHHCPFEWEITDLVKKLSLKTFRAEKMRVLDYTVFFNTVLRVQPERFISRL